MNRRNAAARVLDPAQGVAITAYGLPKLASPSQNFGDGES